MKTLHYALILILALAVGVVGAASALTQRSRVKDLDAAVEEEIGRRQAAEEEVRRLLEERAVREDSVARAIRAGLDSLAAEQRRLADEQRRFRDGIPLPDNTVRDSLRYWHATALSAEAENLALRRERAHTDSAYQIAQGTIARLTQDWLAEQVRANREKGRADLAEDRLRIRKLTEEKPCKILGIIGCPSRTETAAVMLAAGFVLEKQLDRRRD